MTSLLELKFQLRAQSNHAYDSDQILLHSAQLSLHISPQVGKPSESQLFSLTDQCPVVQRMDRAIQQINTTQSYRGIHPYEQLGSALSLKGTSCKSFSTAYRDKFNVGFDQCRSKGRGRGGPCPPQFFSLKSKNRPV